MKTQHTPGPWVACKISDNSGFTVRTNERPELILIPVNLSEVNTSIHSELVGEAEANARLIASAPDMLEAAENMLFAFRSAAKTEIQRKAVQYMDEAINKAKGL